MTSADGMGMVGVPGMEELSREAAILILQKIVDGSGK